MAFQQGTDALICEHCGARHTGRWDRLPVREEQFVPCKACRNPLIKGKSVKYYHDVKLIET